MQSSGPLHGRVALVTGSGRGLGKGCALALAEAGAAVVVNSVHAETAHATAAELAAGGLAARAVVADVSDPAEVERLLQESMTWQGRLDILVNNAGINVVHSIDEISLEEWNRILRVNLTSMFLCCKAALPIMRRQRYGRIINISSIAGLRGALFGDVHYATTKAGQIGFAKTLARTVAAEGITVNCVAPGPISTELLRRNISGERLRRALEEIPRGELGALEEVGATVVFLASPLAAHITGATINVNGGAYMQ